MYAVPDVSTALAIHGLPKIDENNIMDNKTPKERIVERLDFLEGHVEKLRKEACTLEENRDQLLASLDSVKTTDLMNELAESECIC